MSPRHLFKFNWWAWGQENGQVHGGHVIFLIRSYNFFFSFFFLSFYCKSGTSLSPEPLRVTPWTIEAKTLLNNFNNQLIDTFYWIWDCQRYKKSFYTLLQSCHGQSVHADPEQAGETTARPGLESLGVAGKRMLWAAMLYNCGSPQRQDHKNETNIPKHDHFQF